MLFFVLFLVFLLMFTFLLTRPKLQPPLPPGPKPLPFIGSLIPMLRNKPTFKWIHKMMDEMHTKILCIRLGNTHVIAVSDPKIAREFFKDNDDIFSSRPDCMSGYLTSGGYLTTVLVPMGEHWKTMRKTLSIHILSPARHKWLKSKRDQEADNLLRYIYSRCQMNDDVTGGVVNVRTIVQHYLINTGRKMLFGSRYFGKGGADGGPGEEELEHVDSLSIILKHVYAFCVTDYLPLLRWVTDFDGHERILRKAIQTARKYQDPLIDERIQQWKDGIRTHEDDLLDVFINLEDPPLTPDRIKAQILELTLTFDNPTTIIEWVIAEMINQPRIYDRAAQELDLVIGKDRLVQETDLPNLNYIKACVKEAFRLHPVSAFNLTHVASMDAIVAGYFIPKGSHVILSRLGLGRNPDIWDDPLTFNPNCHISGDDEEVVLTDNNLEILTFGTGRRGCPAVSLGSTLTIMLLARLLQGFTWELPPNEQHVDLKESVQGLSMAKPLLALIKPRLPDHNLYRA